MTNVERGGFRPEYEVSMDNVFAGQYSKVKGILESTSPDRYEDATMDIRNKYQGLAAEVEQGN
jgi:hypothetical protein